MKPLPILAALAAAAALATPAAAQMKPATSAHVAQAVEACKAITSPTWIDKDALGGMDWYQVRQRGNGNSGARLYNAYEKRGNRAYLVFEHEDLKAKNCVVMARLEDTAAYGAMAQELAQGWGMPTAQDGFAYIWDGADFTIRMEPSGERDAPNVRVAVKAKGAAPEAPEAIVTQD